MATTTTTTTTTSTTTTTTTSPAAPTADAGLAATAAPPAHAVVPTETPSPAASGASSPTQTQCRLVACSFRDFHSASAVVQFPTVGVATLVGPSGSGKTLVFRAIALVLRVWQTKLNPVGKSKSVPHLLPLFKDNQSHVILLMQWEGKFIFFGVVRQQSDLACIAFQSRDSVPASMIDAGTFSNLEKRCITKDELDWRQRFFDCVSKAFRIVPQDHGLRAHSQLSVHGTAWGWTGQPEDLAKVQLNRDCKDDLLVVVRLKVDKEKIATPSNGFPCFSLNSTPFSHEDLSGGQFDALLVLSALHDCSTADPCQILLLDEPGQNLSAAERILLRRILAHHASKKQIIIITHHTEMLDVDSLPASILSFHHQLLSGTVIRPCNGSLDVEVRHHAFLPLFFASGALLVEGFTDAIVLNVLLDRWCGDLQGRWVVFPCDGLGGVRKVSDQLCTILGVRHLCILDSDALFQPSEEWNKRYEKGASEGSVSGLLHHLGGHAASCLDHTQLRGSALPDFSTLLHYCGMEKTLCEAFSNLSDTSAKEIASLHSPFQKSDASLSHLQNFSRDFGTVFEAKHRAQLDDLIKLMRSERDLTGADCGALYELYQSVLRNAKAAQLKPTLPLSTGMKCAMQGAVALLPDPQKSLVLVLLKNKSNLNAVMSKHPTQIRPLLSAIRRFRLEQLHEFIWPLVIADIEGLLLDKSQGLEEELLEGLRRPPTANSNGSTTPIRQFTSGDLDAMSIEELASNLPVLERQLGLAYTDVWLRWGVRLPIATLIHTFKQTNAAARLRILDWRLEQLKTLTPEERPVPVQGLALLKSTLERFMSQPSSE